MIICVLPFIRIESQIIEEYKSRVEEEEMCSVMAHLAAACVAVEWPRATKDEQLSEIVSEAENIHLQS